jgi:hypothetical protein
VELFIKDRSGHELTEGGEMRLNAYWMGMLLRREWQHELRRRSAEAPHDSGLISALSAAEYSASDRVR